MGDYDINVVNISTGSVIEKNVVKLLKRQYLEWTDTLGYEIACSQHKNFSKTSRNRYIY